MKCCDWSSDVCSSDLDSVRTQAINGEWKTVKYEYESNAIGNPFDGDYYDEHDGLPFYVLKKVISSDGVYVTYSYNSNGELEAIRNSSLGVTSYVYDEYTYFDGTGDCKTRQITQMANSPDNGATNFTTYYNRNVTCPR
jgi:hypothetical protein